MVVALAVVVGVTACSASTRRSGATGSRPPASGPRVTGSLTVLAPASLTEAFNRARSVLTDADPGLCLTLSFAGSNALAAQVRQGAPADVVASADRGQLAKLAEDGVVDPPVVFATNTLEIAVAPGNPRRVTGLADLARADLAVVLGAPGVPAGDYARQALAARRVVVRPRSLETDVKSALAKVTLGEADAAVVYATDVAAAGSKVTGVGIPPGENVVADYAIAVLGTTRNRPSAEAFVRSAVSGDVARAVRDAGFGRP